MNLLRYYQHPSGSIFISQPLGFNATPKILENRRKSDMKNAITHSYGAIYSADMCYFHDDKTKTTV